MRTGRNRNLPLPPIMDPAVQAARQRWTEPKLAPPRVKDMTPFQQKLYRNPYAHALGTPVRACRSSGTHLPSHFFLRLQPTLHPETSEPWLLPTALSAAALPGPGQPLPPAPSAYTLLRQSWLEYLGPPPPVGGFATAWAGGKARAKGKAPGRWRDSLNMRIFERVGTEARKLTWREDMPDLVLRLLRKVAFRALQWGFVRPGGGGVVRRIDGEGLSRLEEVEDVGAVVFLRRLAESPALRRVRTDVMAAIDEGDELATVVRKLVATARKAALKKGAQPTYQQLTEPPPPRLQPQIVYPALEYPTMQWRGRQVPVYDLQELLGAEALEELVGGTAWKEDEAVVLRDNIGALGAHLALTGLKDYVIR
ncbi:uncharacterized protein K452DRAFT_325239 [Aplosporella prunicola CBS 121167]|uniref:Uncharacterized protein n=1 Tax=Aplosporella prunicola CBS 121167 TaxID=1176127 RepID=A0A6A6BKV7_9PEZI|nr:uncharacterized protein K452DRAFT_325239 [Aplosporella prunicola CBS 121167]KAF2144762.1 hypothetical protein K452DRAFT_325239 [Aplosporella prunicola CBS 121167]